MKSDVILTCAHKGGAENEELSKWWSELLHYAERLHRLKMTFFL